MSSGAWDSLPTFDKPESGSWLYQFGGNLYGPVSTDQLLERVRNGAINEQAVVCQDGHDDFVPLLDHPSLKAAVEKALEQAEELRQKKAAQKKKQTNMLVVVVVVGVAVVGAVGGGIYGYREWKHSQAVKAANEKREAEEKARREREEEEQKKQAQLAALNDLEIDMELLPLVSVSSSGNKTKKKKRIVGGKEVDEGPQGCQLDQASMVATFRTAFPQIKGCIRDQSSRGGSLPEQIMLAFTIANNGSVSSFEIEDRNLRSGPFADCVKRNVTALHFQKFPGERCNIEYPITIGKKR